MKYIDLDKLRTEMERLKAENNCGTDEFIGAKNIAYDQLLSFIDTLKTEPEPTEIGVDLEEEIIDYYGCIPDDTDKIEAARHFYELGEHSSENSGKLPSNCDDAANKHADEYAADAIDHELIKGYFKA